MTSIKQFRLLLICFLFSSVLISQTEYPSINNYSSADDKIPTALAFKSNIPLPSGEGSAGATGDGRYLYVPLFNGELHVFDLQNIDSPQKISQLQFPSGINLGHAFYHNQHLYLTTSDKKLHIYDCSNPASLILKSSTDIDGMIHSMSFDENTAYLIIPYVTGLTGKSRFIIMDITNPLSPVEKSRIDINGRGGNGVNLFYSKNRSMVYLRGMLNVSSGSISVINVANPVMPALLNVTNYTMRNDDQLLGYDNYYILSQTASSKTTLHVYSTTDGSNPQLIKSYELPGTKEMMAMKDVDGTLLIYSWPYGAQSLSTFAYDSNTNQFTAGPEIADTEGWGTNEFVIFKAPLTRQSRLNKPLNSGLYYAIFGYGSPPQRMIEIRYGAEKYNLVTSIQPQAAILGGCTVNGAGEYSKNETATVSAIPGGGWVFDNWSGDLAGSANPSSILMNGNKNVVAHFSQLGEPTLTVSGSKGPQIFCPTEIHPDTYYGVGTVTFSADQVSAWSLGSFEMDASGSGDDKLDLNFVKIEGPTTILRQYGSDNGTLQATFTPPIIIPKGGQVSFSISYQFAFDRSKYGYDTVKTFKWRTKGISATPSEYPPGIIQGSAKMDSFAVARVQNMTKSIGYAKVSQAVNTCDPGDLIEVCEGTYEGSKKFGDKLYFELIKASHLKSRSGREKTTLLAYIFWSPDGEGEIILDGFTIKGTTKESLSINPNKNKNSIVINNNLFESLDIGIDIKETEELTIEGNHFNNIQWMAIYIGNNVWVDNKINIRNNYFFDNNYNNDSYWQPYRDLVIQFPGINQGDLNIIANYGKNNLVYEISRTNLDKKFKSIKAFNLIGNKIIEDQGSAEIIVENIPKINFYDNTLSKLNISNVPEVILNNNTLQNVNLSKVTNFNIYDNHFRQGKDVIISESGSGKIYRNNFDSDFSIISSGSMDFPVSEIFENTFTYLSINGIDFQYSKNFIFRDNLIKLNASKPSLLNSIRARGCSVFSISNNTLEQNNNGILLDVSNTFQMRSNKLYKNKEGIILNYSRNGKLSFNDVRESAGNGIQVFGSQSIRINENKSLKNQSYGLEIKSSDEITALANTFNGNCSGVKVIDCPGEIIVRHNIISGNTCWFTGVNIENSAPEITGNTISDNNGNGIFISGGSAQLRSNNIERNNPGGLNASNPSVKINASGNYWGNSSGPQPGDIAGNVNADNWLTTPAKLFASFLEENKNSASGRNDSVQVQIQNIFNPDDSVSIAVTDQRGWLSGINNFTRKLQDSTGYSFNVNYAIPDGNSDNNKIFVRVTSLLDPLVTAADTMTVLAYIPLLNRITITPDSIAISKRDSLIFSVECFDQNEMIMNPEIVYSATRGRIDQRGKFVPDTLALGISIITASNTQSGKSSTVSVYISDTRPEVKRITIISPVTKMKISETYVFEAVCYEEHSFKVERDLKWEATGGTITDFGFFTAGENPGSFQVTATDTFSNVSAVFQFSLEEPTDIMEEHTIPESFMLYQNYPNPFNPVTTIKYSLSTESKVNITVYNILGQRVNELLNQIKGAGTYSVNWHAGRYSSGIYFYRIAAFPLNGNAPFIKTSKMILLK
jgi:hypothetical protein